ncbi:uncharacterized protein LOC111039939 [Myzus persicae]|nr:uncharacterized protein LOC111039939 [Myzus persicae]
MYQMVNSTKYLMAVSSDKSCDGLPQMLSNEQRGLVNWLLPKDESKINLRPTRSASDTKNSIKNFSGSRFFWRTG